MRIGRTLPPAAAPLDWVDICHGLSGAFRPDRAIRGLEDGIRQAFGVRDAFAFSSGTAALAATLTALASLSPRKNVVIPAFTCFSVPAAVARAGLNPLLCDVEADGFDFDATQLAAIVDERTLCVVAHHLFGVPSAIDRTRDVCRRHGAFLVEDAAQAMGLHWQGRPLGTVGDAGILSFGRGKNVTCGSGGMVVTDAPAIATALRRLHGTLEAPRLVEQLADSMRVALMMVFIRPSLYWLPASLPFLGLGRTTYPTVVPVRRLSGFQAGLLRRWRRRLARSNRARAAAVAYFTRGLGLNVSSRESLPCVRMPIVARDRAIRDRVCAESRQRGLGLAVGYPAPINDIPEIAPSFAGQHFPRARRLSERLVTLPTHHWLSDRDKQAIVDACRDLLAA